MQKANNILDSPIENLKTVGTQKAEMLKKELSIFTFRDLLFQYPFRYIDRTSFHRIRDLNEQSGDIQLKGILRQLNIIGDGRKRRMVGRFRDESGVIDLVWFTGIQWLNKQLIIGQEYVVFGRVNAFRGQLNIPHPEMEAANTRNTTLAATFAPVYSSTDKLNKKGLDSRTRRRMMRALFDKVRSEHLPENLSPSIIQLLRLSSHYEALKNIHFPKDQETLNAARKRLKFEELFFLQLRILQNKKKRKGNIKGYNFSEIGAFFNQFYNEKLPFELTGAQKRVIKEIRRDLGMGIQMNRLLQGDVGSGKTIVGLMTMLIALDNGYQTCLMAPTEILAQQHYSSISKYLEGMDIEVGFLSGSVKGKKRREVLEQLENGTIQIIIGTHALLEEPVVFKNLGLAITDEQHRFGVAQRARLWRKSKPFPPHILVMTATPIPRTLAMTLYGDLDVSVIDELPPGRKPVQTIHRTENHRMRIIGFMREEIAKGRQVYVVYPLIEESETLDLQNLEEGYEALKKEFPSPEYQISIVHGKMKPADKDYEMQRFIEQKTQIMVATTVIEVGVNVPNASVMVIENTERFGLSQLHQLRGRVGRGADQSYCILMSSFKLSTEAKQRIQTMTSTNNGFEIAEADLKLRGPGNIEGTQQSGIVNLRIADLAKDGQILQVARKLASDILESDPEFKLPENAPIKRELDKLTKKNKGWSLIS